MAKKGRRTKPPKRQRLATNVPGDDLRFFEEAFRIVLAHRLAKCGGREIPARISIERAPDKTAWLVLKLQVNGV